MSTPELELLRLYLADPTGADEVFKDQTLQLFLDTNEGDVNAAAADGWRAKAATVAEWYQMNIDGAFLSRDQVFQHCVKMADHFESQGGGSIVNVKMDSGFEDEQVEAEF